MSMDGIRSAPNYRIISFQPLVEETLKIYLPGFKKEDLYVRLLPQPQGLLQIGGIRVLNEEGLAIDDHDRGSGTNSTTRAFELDPTIEGLDGHGRIEGVGIVGAPPSRDAYGNLSKDRADEGATSTTQRSYEKIEPATKQFHESILAIEISLPTGFKKEDLKVKLQTEENELDVNGEHHKGENRWIRFAIKVPVQPDSKIDDFSAKLNNGVLRIASPKIVFSKEVKEVKAPNRDNQVIDNTHTEDLTSHHHDTETSTNVDDHYDEPEGKLSSSKSDQQREGMAAAEMERSGRDIGSSVRDGAGEMVEMLKRKPRLVASAAVAVIVVASIGAYAAYMVRSRLSQRE
ncbi:hypothetical protein Sjap_008739 [Stephania japonica]|uniref:SHSP domain-containing protein n=1 Tax=Stephania japonica TaxID=461633 RepID=A0AAP0PEX6_9MAGN